MKEQDAAFDALYRAEWGRLVSALTLTGGDRRTAEEIAQETFERAWARWRRVRQLERPAGWLFRTGFRLQRRRLGRAGARAECSVAADPATEGPEAAAVDRMVVTAVIARLPFGQRQALVARHVLGLTTADAASALGISEAALRQLLHRAVVAVRAAIETEEAR